MLSGNFMRLIIYDFCDTLVNFQTGDEYCRYVLRKNQRRIWLLYDRVFSQTNIYRLVSKFVDSFERKFLLFTLRRINVDFMDKCAESFYTERIRPNFNTGVLERLQLDIKEGNYVVINSGGYAIYLKYFVKDFGVNNLFSSRLSFSNGLFEGKINGAVCLGQEKVIRMTKANVRIEDYDEIIVYSDSPSDLPLFSIASSKFAILKSSKIPEWCKIGYNLIYV